MSSAQLWDAQQQQVLQQMGFRVYALNSAPSGAELSLADVQMRPGLRAALLKLLPDLDLKQIRAPAAMIDSAQGKRELWRTLRARLKNR